LGSRCTLLRPGLVDYGEALALQARTADGVRAGGHEALILLQHPPTYTLGARGRSEHVLASAAALAARGAVLVRTDRGGDVTYHGPGQIVGYPIMNLRARSSGPVSYVRALEQTLIDALSSFGVAGSRRDGYPGVWSGAAKIAAIGVRISRGVTTHGFALNVNTDLEAFAQIIPCGIPAVEVTSMMAVAGHEFDIHAVEDAIAGAFARVFGVEFVTASTPQTEEALVGR